MFNRPIKHTTLGLLFVVLLMFLILGLSAPTYAVVSPQGPSDPTPERIVLLYSYGDGIPAYQEATRAFLSVMKEGRVSVNNLFFEYLDLERNKDKEHKNNLVTLLRHKYAKEKVDLIVTVHTPALRFLLNEGRNLFPKTPVLSYLAPDIIETAGVERQFLLLPMQMDFRGTLELAQRLFPKTMRVVFINGIGEGEKRLEREAKSVFLQWHDKLEFEYTSDLSVEEMLQRIATLPPQTIVIYSNVFTDKTGRTFVAKDVAERVAKAANAPVFGMYNTILGSGIIGGSVFNFETEGARAAAVALDILKGKISLTKPVTILTASRIPMFDWPPLKRWGLDESALPPGSIVLNRPALGWKEHTLEIIGILAFCLVETALIIILIVQRRRRRSAEESLKQKTEELDQFFNISIDLLCIANTEGYFLRLNPVWEKVLGYSRDELMSKRFMDFVHPDDVRSTTEVVASLASRKAVTYFMNRYQCKDGTYRWLEWSAVPAGNLIYAGARDITERKRAEEASRESERILRENENDLRRLAGRLIYAHEEERSRLARELHDDLAQRLAVFAIDVGKLEQQLVDSPAPVQEELYEMKKDIVKISQDVHSLSRQLHPSILDDLGLIKAVESECTNFSRREGIEIVFNHENIPTVIPKDISLSLYRIIQEGLSNISKYACADHISVSLKGIDHDVLLSVHDDGIGFDSAEVNKKPGLGFSSMRERARLIHGELSIQSQPEKGTLITVRVPITREGE